MVQPAIYWHAIKIDLERTFPNNPYYRTGGTGLGALFKVMKAYSNYDTTVGYCQGKNIYGPFAPLSRPLL